MDFIVGFPHTGMKYDSFLVSVDIMTKSAYFTLVKASYSGEEYAKLYLKEIVRMNGVPLSIISYRGTQLTFISGKHSKVDRYQGKT